MTSQRVQRFLQAFDWKLIISLFALCVVLVVLLGKVQDTQTIDRQDKSLSKANDTVERNSRIIEQLNEDAAARSVVASRERKALVRRIDLLTRILRDNGLEVPDTAADLDGTASSPSLTPSGNTPLPRPRGTKPSAGGTSGSTGTSGGSAAGSSGSGGGTSGGGSPSAPTPAPTTPSQPRGGLLAPVGQLPIVCSLLLGPCP
jgi:uncharacterized membrane protein YgcG